MIILMAVIYWCSTEKNITIKHQGEDKLMWYAYEIYLVQDEHAKSKIERNTTHNYTVHK